MIALADTQTCRVKMYPFGDEITSHDEVVLRDSTVSRKNRIKPAVDTENKFNDIFAVRSGKHFPLDKWETCEMFLPECLLDESLNEWQLRNVICSRDSSTKYTCHFLRDLLLHHGMLGQEVCAP